MGSRALELSWDDVVMVVGETNASERGRIDTDKHCIKRVNCLALFIESFHGMPSARVAFRPHRHDAEVHRCDKWTQRRDIAVALMQAGGMAATTPNDSELYSTSDGETKSPQSC